MKHFSITLLLGLFLFNSANASDVSAGKKLFDTHCASCHGVTGGMDMSKRLAPPIAGVRRHYIGTYSDEFSFVNAIANWVAEPDISKTQMRGAIRRFNLMPKISIKRSDVETIAAYIYKGDIESPAGFKEHEMRMHGSH